MWKNKEQPVVKTGKMCRIAQNYEHGRALPLHAVRWLGIMIDSQNIPLRRMSTNEIRYRGECGQQSISINADISPYSAGLKTFCST